MPNQDGSETEQEYQQRISSVPGIFSDRNESAETVVNRPAVHLVQAEEAEKRTPLAPAVHPGEERPEIEVPRQNLAHIEATQVPGYQPPAEVPAEKVDSPEEETSETDEETEETPEEDHSKASEKADEIESGSQGEEEVEETDDEDDDESEDRDDPSKNNGITD